MGKAEGRAVGSQGTGLCLNPNPGSPWCHHSNETPGSLSRWHLFNAPPMSQLCACLILRNPHDNPAWAILAHFSGVDMGAHKNPKTRPRSHSQHSTKRRLGPCQGCLCTCGVSTAPLVSNSVSCFQFLVSYSSPSFYPLFYQLREAWGKPGHAKAGCCPSPRAWGQTGTSIPSIKRLTSSDHNCSSLGWKPKEHSVSRSTLASPPLPEPSAHPWGGGGAAPRWETQEGMTLA